MISIVSPLL